MKREGTNIGKRRPRDELHSQLVIVEALFFWHVCNNPSLSPCSSMSNVRFCPKKSVIYLSALVEHVSWQTGSKLRTPKFSIDVCKVPWWCPLSYSSVMGRWGLSESVHGLRSKRRKKTNITGSNHLHTIRRTVSENMRVVLVNVNVANMVNFCHLVTSYVRIDSKLVFLPIFANMRICKQIGN